MPSPTLRADITALAERIALGDLRGDYPDAIKEVRLLATQWQGNAQSIARQIAAKLTSQYSALEDAQDIARKLYRFASVTSEKGAKAPNMHKDAIELANSIATGWLQGKSNHGNACDAIEGKARFWQQQETGDFPALVTHKLIEDYSHVRGVKTAARRIGDTFQKGWQAREEEREDVTAGVVQK